MGADEAASVIAVSREFEANEEDVRALLETLVGRRIPREPERTRRTPLTTAQALAQWQAGAELAVLEAPYEREIGALAGKSTDGLVLHCFRFDFGAGEALLEGSVWWLEDSTLDACVLKIDLSTGALRSFELAPRKQRRGRR